MEKEYVYDGCFNRNVLVVGRTGCGKTTFIQRLGPNNLFGDIIDVFWISKIILSSEKIVLFLIKKYNLIIQKI